MRRTQALAPRQTHRPTRGWMRAAGPFARRPPRHMRGRARWARGGPARASLFSLGSIASVLSILSLRSAGSILSIGSLGSVLSIGSAGSILSIGSVGSILSIGSAGSVLRIGARRAVLDGQPHPARPPAPPPNLAAAARTPSATGM